MRDPYQSRMDRELCYVTASIRDERLVAPNETRRPNHRVVRNDTASRGKRADLVNPPVPMEDVVVHTLYFVHYIVDGSVGMIPESIN